MIDEGVIRDVLSRALGTGAEFAEIYAESRFGSSVRLDDEKVAEVSGGRDRGAGVRVIHGRSAAYAYTNRLDRDSLLEAAAVAAAGLSGEPRTAIHELRREPERVLAAVERPPSEIGAGERAEMVRRMDATARSAGGEVRQVLAAYADLDQDVLIANSDGLLAADRRVRTRLVCQVVAIRDGVVMTGVRSIGATRGFELTDTRTPEEIAQDAAQQAITMLDARPAPAAEMPVVLAPGGGGVLFHEACGHGLEADGIEKGTSVFAGRLGEQIGSELVTGVDDASMAGEWGSFGYDDEGTPSSRTVVFEKGVLQSYLVDRLRGRLLGLDPTGNGRRQSYAHLPVPRMTNTFIVPGDASPEAVIKEVDHGLYAKSFGGGQVDPATGDFVFGLTEAYVIERGELAYPVRSATLVGNGPEVLGRIDAVANDFDLWTGMCGKEGQMVPANVGLPTLRVSRMTVGGTGA